MLTTYVIYKLPENVFKYSGSHDQDGFQAHIQLYGKTFKHLVLRNQEADDLETWYTASGTQILSNTFTILSLA